MTQSLDQPTDRPADADHNHISAKLLDHAPALAHKLTRELKEDSTQLLVHYGFPKIEFQHAKHAVHETERHLEGAVKKEALKALNDHVGDLVLLVSKLPAGKIDVAGAFATAKTLDMPLQVIIRKLGLPADERTMHTLANIQSIEKSPHGVVTLRLKSDEVIPLGIKFGPANAVQISDIRIAKKVTFELASGSTELSRIFGISIEGEGGLPKRPLVSNVRDIKFEKNPSGETVISTQASNPENSIERYLTKDGDDIRLKIKLKHDGKVDVSHEKHSDD